MSVIMIKTEDDGKSLRKSTVSFRKRKIDDERG